MADEPAEAELDARVDRLESGQGRIERMLEQLTGSVHASAEEHTEERLGKPTTIEEMVRRELEAKEAKAKEKADKDADATDRKTMREQMAELRAKLTEERPVQPQPRRQRVMWGKR